MCYLDFHHCQKLENKDMCMLSADESELYFHVCCLQKEIQNKFSSLEFLPLPSVSPSETLLSLPTYFKRVLFYLAVWTPNSV